jgi:triosephosphate isomerase
MAKKRLVVGNWKMYIESPEEARRFTLSLRRRVRGLAGVEVWLAPPAPFIPLVADVLESSRIYVGAQKISPHEDPQHTGSVSAKMLKAVGASFAIIGHSERRAEGETDEKVRSELLRATETGLAPILCIGENVREKDGEHFEVLEKQLTSALTHVPQNTLKKLVIAYEPVWAIGKRSEDSIGPADLQEMVIFIKKVLTDLLDRRVALKVPILYGGSVEPENAPALIAEGGVSGFLVGHASAQIDSFLEIIKATQN